MESVTEISPEDYIEDYEIVFRDFIDGSNNSKITGELHNYVEFIIFRLSDQDFFWRMCGKSAGSVFGYPVVNDCLITPYGIVRAYMSIHLGKSVEYWASLTTWDDISYLRLQGGTLWMRKLGSPADEKISDIKEKRTKDLVVRFAQAQRDGLIPARFSLVKQPPGMARRVLSWAVSLVIWLAIIGYFVDRKDQDQSAATSAALCSVVSAVLKPDVFIDSQGNPDAGQTVEMIVKNVGETGDITLQTRLTNSEGQWDRQQVIRFTANEQKSLRFTFPEPTINATNDQGTYSCLPEEKPK